MAFDWDTLNRAADHASALDLHVDTVRATFDVEQVDLMGHSAGGGLGYDYLADPDRAAKVAHYVHVGSFANEAPAGPEAAPVPTLNIWSPDDTVVDGADIPGAENLDLPGRGHYAVATDPAAFTRLYAFLYGAEPETSASAPAAPVTVSGRAATLGANAAATGAGLQIWPLDAASGQRTGAAPEHTLIVGDDGRWGPVTVQAGVPYELHITPTDGGHAVHYYREPFTRSDHLVYLRTLPTDGLAGALLGGIPFDDAHTTAVVFSASEAVLNGRDTLTVDGEDVATPELASAEDTLIALFVYDDAADGQDGEQVGVFASFPFLNGLDRFIAADATASLTVALNGRTLVAPRWPSGTEGAVIFVFD